jgi:hypothetical protein
LYTGGIGWEGGAERRAAPKLAVFGVVVAALA